MVEHTLSVLFEVSIPSNGVGCGGWQHHVVPVLLGGVVATVRRAQQAPREGRVRRGPVAAQAPRADQLDLLEQNTSN